MPADDEGFVCPYCTARHDSERAREYCCTETD